MASIYSPTYLFIYIYGKKGEQEINILFLISSNQAESFKLEIK